MAGFSSGLKEKLKITACKIDKGEIITPEPGANSFEVLINPAGYKRSLSIAYNTRPTLGQSGAEAKFSAICPEKLTLPELVLDGTGVVTLLGLESVSTQVRKLLAVVYDYQGDKHEPNYVQIVWGKLMFYGRVESIDIDYTLFKPSGEPLRAKVQLGVVGSKSRKENNLLANPNSPDLSHLVEVKAGDTLPLLCERIYKNPAYYLAVARYNNLSAFRDLAPGQTLRFPPVL